jgi:hypothetical protein
MGNKGNFWIDHVNGVAYLYERGFEWMDDSPAEMKGHDFAVEAASGKVLIGGLGLGCIVKRLQEKPEVTEIVVVEIDQDVIDLVWEHLDVLKASIVNADLADYLETVNDFDYIYMDVWPEKGHESIAHWRALAEQKLPSDKVLCWGEL